jgi:hypothetical protein
MNTEHLSRAFTLANNLTFLTQRVCSVVIKPDNNTAKGYVIKLLIDTHFYTVDFSPNGESAKDIYQLWLADTYVTEREKAVNLVLRFQVDAIKGDIATCTALSDSVIFLLDANILLSAEIE